MCLRPIAYFRANIVDTFFSKQPESLDNPERLSGGEIIKTNEDRNSGDPLVVEIGK